MADKYTSVSVTNYNANPPADDGSVTEANRLKWSTIKTKLADTIKTALDAINTNIIAMDGKIDGGVTSTAISYQVLSTDQGKLVRASASGITLTTPDAAGVGAPFVFEFLNDSTGNITLDGSGSQTIDGDATVTVPAGAGGRLRTNGSNWFTTGQNFQPEVPSIPGAVGLVIVNNSTTPSSQIDITADHAVMVAPGPPATVIYASSVSVTVNTATTGANALDTGSKATSTWYNLFLISNGTTTAGLASLSATAPTLPSGYTYFCRVGAMRTDGSGNFFRTKQLGNQAAYTVVAATNTAAYPTVTSGSTGTINSTTFTGTSTAIASFAPPTATKVRWVMTATNTSAKQALAPSNSFAGYDSTTNMVPYLSSGNGAARQNPVIADIQLEGANVFYASDQTSTLLQAQGWTDKVNAT